MPLENGAERPGKAKLIYPFAVTLGAAILAGLFSMNAHSIYASLERPAFAPPGWVFMPVWIFLYILMAIAFYLVRKEGKGSARVKNAGTYFILQLIFNVLWSILFFALGLRAAAFVDIVVLLIYIIVVTYKFYRIKKAAGILMLPYLFWVLFAAVLNFSIIMLNG